MWGVVWLFKVVRCVFQALSCLVQIASVRRSLFNNQERAKFLNHLVQGVKNVLQNPQVRRYIWNVRRGMSWLATYCLLSHMSLNDVDFCLFTYPASPDLLFSYNQCLYSSLTRTQCVGSVRIFPFVNIDQYIWICYKFCLMVPASVSSLWQFYVPAFVYWPAQNLTQVPHHLAHWDHPITLFPLWRHSLFARQGLTDANNYHEFCRLLARLKSNYQLGELVMVDNYPDVIRLVAKFTVESLQVGGVILSHLARHISRWHVNTAIRYPYTVLAPDCGPLAPRPGSYLQHSSMPSSRRYGK